MEPTQITFWTKFENYLLIHFLIMDHLSLMTKLSIFKERENTQINFIVLKNVVRIKRFHEKWSKVNQMLH